ncbi:MAG: type I restriction-modification enzyme R subunit C-terminal domain-containing protein [Thiobacillus sp.]|uniref:type I restriction endonuclease subunit R n=1 Tax=Thiobacillus sp. TaxID=924 RepID=UPI002894F3BC|nr:DEAD/DEAH box helicase family protein [Thiobacillus sp.]MDT3706097.1 type I restriction-modification enzyme R subunit C-terminal domain-containing protein [Thiobacillus sp.]
MAPQPEQQARGNIDRLLEAAGWHVCDAAAANIHAARGVAIREFPLPGYGFADYLLYVDGKAAGVVEAKKEGVTLTGVETQSDKYTKGLPAGLPRWSNPLPFAYQSTGVETRFTNGLDPVPRSRPVFAFHQPKLLAEWLAYLTPSPQRGEGGGEGERLAAQPTPTFLARLQHMPPLKEEGLWPAQITAIRNLEKSLKENRPRALIQMATGSGKTFTSISFIYRLIKFAGARRILFLVDRGNLADQTLKEFQQYVSPYNNFKFSEEYIVQRLQGNQIDTTARVCICTLQRMYSMLKGKDLPPDLEEVPVDQLTLPSPASGRGAGGEGQGVGAASLFAQPEPIEYNPAIPIETFDIIVTDEAHRSIYNLWAQVLEYFDAYLVGLTATPGKQTFGFFHQNLVMEYNHEMAVADGVNVNYDVYRIKTAITEGGSKVEAGYYVEKQERDTRKTRWEELDDDFAYDPNQLDRDVVTPDQIRTIVRTFRDKLFSEIFPGRTEVPKTLIFAKDDNHAENIVEILREEFGKGNEFAQKITYRTTGATPKELISAFRNSYHPRVAVTVDMIATGTDIKPVEIVFFMRAVKSRGFFEQMKGRGVRVIKPDDLRAVTPDAKAKDHFVIIDAVGVCEQDKTDARPMEKKPSVSFERLLQAVAFGNTEDDVITSIAGRLARMEHRISAEDDARIRIASGGLGLKDLAHQLVQSLSPDLDSLPSPASGRGAGGEGAFTPSPLWGEGRGEGAAQQARINASKPLCDPALRQLILDIKAKNELTIDHVSPDHVIFAGFTEAKARDLAKTFKEFIEEHKDEITALQILYSRPYKARLDLSQLRELADAVSKNIRELSWYRDDKDWDKEVTAALWQAYAKLDESHQKGTRENLLLTDLISVVRLAMNQTNELVPYPERVRVNFDAWLGQQQSAGRKFNEEQMWWLTEIRKHIEANLHIEPDDFELAPFAQEGGLGKVYQLFGDDLNTLIEQLNESLAA